MPEPAPSNPHSLLMIGGGPRAVSQATAEVVFQHVYASHFAHLHSLGARYELRTTILEQRPVIAHGASCSSGQTGMMNTGIEHDIRFPLPLPLPGDAAPNQRLLSYRQRYEQMLQGRVEHYYEKVRKVNLPGAVMFKTSTSARSTTPRGLLDHSGAYLMRTTVGEEEHHNFHQIRRLAGELPFYTLDVVNSCKAHALTIGDGVHHVHFTTEASPKGTTQACVVRLNTGTTTRNPIPDSAVREETFCELMNAHVFKAYCGKRDLLDQDGLLKQGSRILSGGVCLSGLDQISVLDHVMNLFEEDEQSLLGYRVSEHARRRYQGAITLLSRTPGKVIPPRHATGFEWLQGTPVLGRTRNLHSLFLHASGEHVFDIWVDILKANIARASCRTPGRVANVSSTFKGALKVQENETKWFLECRKKAEREENRGNMEGKQHFIKESSKTLYGAWRQAALSLIFGFGLEEDGDAATQEMGEFAPLTWKGREVWLFHRAQLKSITEPGFARKTSNAGMMKNFNMLMQHITSSPVEIHSMLHLLSEAGIARHQRASYADIHSEHGKLVFHDEEYDGLLVSPVFERNENAVIKSLQGQVKPYDEAKPTYGQVGKFRRLVDRDGNTTSIEDNGLSGKGCWGDTTTGEESLLGCYATDVNNRASGISIASSCTLRRMAAAHLHAAGIENGEDVLEEIYEDGMPSKEEFEEEVGKFKMVFEETFEIWAYLEGIRHVAGDDSEYYRVLFDCGLSRKERKERMRLMSLCGGIEREGYMVYKNKMKEMPRFCGVQRDEYYARFVDTTDEEDRRIYERAYEIAERRLEERLVEEKERVV